MYYSDVSSKYPLNTTRKPYMGEVEPQKIYLATKYCVKLFISPKLYLSPKPKCFLNRIQRLQT